MSRLAASILFVACVGSPLTAQDPSPVGAVSYFSEACPAGWARYDLGTGRTIVPVASETGLRRAVGTPLAEGELPRHEHEGQVRITLDGSTVRRFSQFSGQFEIANLPPRPIDLDTTITPESSELPVVKLETCIKEAAPAGATPPGMVLFFGEPACPTGWSPFGAAAGRILTGAVNSPGPFGGARALADGEDRLHSHLAGGPAELDNIELSVWSGCSTCSHRWVLDEKFLYRGQARPASSGLPYVQLLACSKDAPTGPRISRITHGADFQERPLTVGQHATLFGAGLGPLEGVGATLDENGEVSRSLAGVRVLADEVEAPLFFVRDDQINFQMPFELLGRATVRIRVVNNGEEGLAAEAALAAAAPALFATGADPSQAIAVHADGSLNSAANPAGAGDSLVFYATGGGQTAPPGRTGMPAGQPFPAPLADIEVWIGAEQAQLDYAGAAPGFVGLMQINARMTAASGRSRVVLRAGDQESAAETYIYGPE